MGTEHPQFNFKNDYPHVTSTHKKGNKNLPKLTQPDQIDKNQIDRKIGMCGHS